MILVNKPDKKFGNECSLLQQQVEKQVGELVNVSLEQLNEKIHECKTLASGGEISINDLILKVLPALCAICKQTDPNASTYHTSEVAILGAIAGCKRVVLNMELSQQERNLALLTSIVTHAMLNETVHIICASPEEAQTLLGSLNERLLGFGIKSALVTNSNDVPYIQAIYTNSVLFGSYQDFVSNSVSTENIYRRISIPREVAIITDVNVITNHAADVYSQNLVLKESKRIIGLGTIAMLCQRYKTVLGFSSCNHIFKYLFRKIFFTKGVELYDYMLTKREIKYVKGSYSGYKTFIAMAKNYNIDFERICNSYKYIQDECTLAIKQVSNIAKVELLKDELTKYFVQNPSSKVKDVFVKVNDEVASIKFIPSEINNIDNFATLVADRVLEVAASIAWDEYTQTYFAIHNYSVALAMGRKNEVQRPNTAQLMLDFSKAQGKLKQYATDSLNNSQFTI